MSYLNFLFQKIKKKKERCGTGMKRNREETEQGRKGTGKKRNRQETEHDRKGTGKKKREL